VEQRIVIKFLIGENVPSAEIHHRLQQQYGEECLYICAFVGTMMYIKHDINLLSLFFMK